MDANEWMMKEMNGNEKNMDMVKWSMQCMVMFENGWS